MSARLRRAIGVSSSLLALALAGCGGGGGGGDPPAPARPDLTMTAFTAPSTGTAGASIIISGTVSNSGTASAGAFAVGVYLSTDSTISTADVFLGFVDVTSLAAGATASDTVIANLPANLAAGTYFLGAIADDEFVVTESNEGNNVSVARQITIAAAGNTPDLSATAFTAPGTGTAGTTISVNSTVQNVGTAAAGAFEIGIYLSTNNVISTSDTLVGTRSVSSLAAGASSAGATTVTLPNVAAGTYFLGAIADHASVVSETDENNNVSSAATIVISVSTPMADLAMTALSAPSSATAGTTISVSNTVSNGGGASAGTFSVGIYLSTDSTITTADTLIGTRSVSSLGAGGTSPASTTATLPANLASGTYFIGAIADTAGQVSESSESNNVSSAAQITITAVPATPDLTVTAFTAPSSAAAGTRISVSDTVANSGTASAGEFDVGIYLSTDSTVTSSDTLLDFRTISSLAAGASSSSGAGSILLPGDLTPGSYFIGAIADDLGEVTESSESNNVSVRSITVTAPTCTVDAFEADDTQGTAKSFTVNAAARSHNFCDDATDWASFFAFSGLTYTLETFVIGAEADTVLELYSTNGTTLITSNDDKSFGDFGSRIVVTPGTTGTYYVKIRSFASVVASDTAYTFRVTQP